MTLSIADAAREHPDRVALIDGDTPYTYAALAARAAAIDPPATLVADRSAATAIAIYAALDRHQPITLIHPRLTQRERRQLPSPPVAPVTLYTSGTTGSPKPIPLTRDNLLAAAAASAAHLGWQPDDRWLCPIPLAHVGGLSVLTRCLIARTCAVLCAPDAIARAIAEHRVTLASVVPALLPRIQAPHRLRAVLVGGAAASPRLLAEARARGINALATYGMTESCAQIATEPIDPDARDGGLIPLPGVEVRVVGGRIQVRGRTVTPLAGEDWLDTGDLGALDALGRLRVLGRADDLIVTGGENVHPAEVEAALLAHPDIADACVFGHPDDTWGAIVCAAIVPRGALDVAALAAALRRSLASHKRPRRIAVVDALPRTGAGKLDRTRCARLPTTPIRDTPGA